MTPEQALSIMLRAGDELERRALRVILRAFSSAETRLLVAQIVQAMQSASPSERLRYKDQLLAIARAVFPSLPDDLLTLARSAAQAGADAAAGMVPIAAPFVQPAVAEVLRDAEAIVRSTWKDMEDAHVGRVGNLLTRALTSGGRYPVARDLQAITGISRKAAQGWAGDLIMTTLSTAQDATVGRAVGDTGAQVMVRWVATADPRTRALHAARGGKVVEYGRSFKAGVTLRYPRDPRCGDLSETRRCRCSATYKIAD